MLLNKCVHLLQNKRIYLRQVLCERGGHPAHEPCVDEPIACQILARCSGPGSHHGTPGVGHAAQQLYLPASGPM